MLLNEQVKSYNRLVLETLQGEYQTFLSASDIKFLEVILLEMPIQGAYEVIVNDLLVATHQLRSGLLLISTRIRDQYETAEVQRIDLKANILSTSESYFANKNIKKPTIDQRNNYALNNVEYKILYERAIKLKTIVQFLDSVKEVLTSRERLMSEVSMNIRALKK